jgi:AT-rich DNA-binding protein
MEKNKSISKVVIRRLPKYYRHLEDLVKKDVDVISSRELGEKLDLLRQKSVKI